MINAIELKMTNSSYVNESGNQLSFLPEISRINILVGENNSGKSRFVRSLVNNKNAIILSDSIGSNKSAELQEIRVRIKASVENLGKKEEKLHIHKNHNKLSPCSMYTYYRNVYDELGIANKRYDPFFQRHQSELTHSLQSLYNMISKPKGGNPTTLGSIPKVYIPILRGVECFDLYFGKQDPVLESISMNSEQRKALDAYKNNASKIYGNKIKKVYGIDERAIFTGENLYIEIRNKLLSDWKDRVFVKELEDFVSSCFYNGDGFTIIPIIEKGYLHVKIGTNEERPLHDLGDGIKQIICIMYKAFEYRNNEAIICIEEPEINLHPGFQRKLIEILQRPEFAKLTFIITTHSNHIVDSCFDYDNISIYKFCNVGRTGEHFQVINSSPKDIDILNVLGVNNSSVFMSNATIWVEGLSDKIYLSCYLKYYMKDRGLIQYKEGVDYTFVEYGGNNVTHWAFEDGDSSDLISASGITNRAFMIVDNDNDTKIERKEHLKKAFNGHFLELPVREIENTIKIEVLESILFDSAPVYKKGAEKKRDRLETKKAFLWKFIDDHYELKKKYWNPHKNVPTVSKIEFAKRVCSKINSENDLTESAKTICEKVYNFISEVSDGINE